jgi:hypothetical protein
MANTSSALLTESQVSEIRLRASILGESQTSLAKEYGVGRSTIGDIVNYRTWKNVKFPKILKENTYQLSDGRVYSCNSKKFLQVSVEKKTNKKYVRLSNGRGQKVKYYLT